MLGKEFHSHMADSLGGKSGVDSTAVENEHFVAVYRAVWSTTHAPMLRRRDYRDSVILDHGPVTDASVLKSTAEAVVEAYLERFGPNGPTLGLLPQ